MNVPEFSFQEFADVLAIELFPFSRGIEDLERQLEAVIFGNAGNQGSDVKIVIE